MFEFVAGMQGAVFLEGAQLLRLSVLAIAAGLVAGRLVDTGVRARSIPVLCGLTGVYAGTWLEELCSWHPRPHIAGQALLPALLGTLAVTMAVKLVALGMAGARR